MRTPLIPPPKQRDLNAEWPTLAGREVRALASLIMRAQEMRASGPKKERIQELREKQTSLQHNSENLLRELKNDRRADYWARRELTAQQLGKHWSEQRRAKELGEIAAGRQESEEVRAIWQAAGGDPAQAVKGFREYAATHPNNHHAYCLLAEAQMKNGDKVGSLASFADALQIAGDETRSGSFVRIRRGRALSEIGELDEAAADFDYVIEHATHFMEVFAAAKELGDAFKRAGRTQAAIEAWELEMQYSASTKLAEMVRKKIEEARRQPE